MPISLTPKAAHRVRQTLAKRGSGLGLRLGVKVSGCSGLSYTLEFADAQKSGESRFESEGVVLLVEAQNLPFLDGTELDFVREGLSEGFKFRNPQAREECGCGGSFSVGVAPGAPGKE